LIITVFYYYKRTKRYCGLIGSDSLKIVNAGRDAATAGQIGYLRASCKI